jgi:hypothetical protein
MNYKSENHHYILPLQNKYFFYYAIINHSNSFNLPWIPSNAGYFQNGAFQNGNRYSPLKPLTSLAEFNSRVCMSVCVTLCVYVFVWEVRVCVSGVANLIGWC